MIKFRAYQWLAVLLLALISAVAPSAPTIIKPTTQPAAAQLLDTRFATQVKPVLTQYCFSCHGNGKHKGDITLDKYNSWKEVQADKQTWQTVMDVLAQGIMPPEEKPQPARKVRQVIDSGQGSLF